MILGATWYEVAAVGLVLIGVAEILRETWRMHQERLAIEAADLIPSHDECDYTETYGDWVREQMMRRIHERA